jgi:hypothetical protein
LLYLGWYRHCGFIPYTQDVDLGLFAEEYDESIRNYFLGNPVIYLWGALGLVSNIINKILIKKQTTNRLMILLNFVFLLVHIHLIYFGHIVKKIIDGVVIKQEDLNTSIYILKIKLTKIYVFFSIFRRILPLLSKLCSADLFGYIFSIPCSPIDYLNNEYGVDTWKKPLEKKYKWINIKYDSIWNDISWMYAVRLYTSDGKLRTDKFAMDWILDQFNYSLKTIPSFLNVLPNKSVTLPSVKNIEK